MSNFEQYVLGETEELLLCTDPDEHRAILQSLIRQTTRQLDILTHDFDPAFYNNEQTLAIFEELALIGGRHLQIRLLIQEPQQVALRGHCILTLGRRLSSVFVMRRPAETHRTFPETFLIADINGFWHRPYRDSFKAFSNFHDGVSARELRKTFEMLWNESEDDPYLRMLHL
ncbi:MAG: hypothetical protein RIT27_1623 [Pseudomonadota bacterium]|jgi:hypothetical protein